jgi:hypothetical protein
VKRGNGLQRHTPLRTSRERRTGRRGTGPDRSTRELTLERDDYTCACCGNSIYGRQYSLQHRLARGMGGTSDPAANRPSNLITLCGSATSPGGCHLACEERAARLNGLGFWLKNHQRPRLEPVAHAIHGWVYLLDDGSVMDALDTGGAA